MNSNDLVYVYGTTKDEPILHGIAEPPDENEKNYWMVTLCGEKMCFSFGTAILPRKHAEEFAVPCSACF